MTEQSRLAPRAHLVLAILILAATAFLIWRPPLWGSHDPIPTTLPADAAFLVVGAAIALALWRFAGRWGWPLRVVLYLVTIVFGGMAGSRLLLEVRERTATAFWPPKVGPARAVVLDSLSPRDAAEWGLRLALHAAGEGASNDIPGIPADWAFPAGVTLAPGSTPSGPLELWTRAGSGAAAIACHAAVATIAQLPPSARQTPACAAASSAPARLRFVQPHRSPPDITTVLATSSFPAWPQHRADARRAASSHTADSTAVRGWNRTTHTEVRAGSSVVGNLLLVGGHNTGLVAALDVATGEPRWITRVPNWVHQEPVSDGRVAIVGFGDNERSFWGRAPSGVAAFDVATGRRLWTRFDESSVMTSPVLLDSTLVYASAAGVVRKRRIATGELLAERELDGGAVMAPPLIVGDTVVVALEADQVCALLAGDLRTLWCHRFAGQQMLGHASPSVDDGIVIASGVATPVGASLKEFLSLPAGLQLRSIGTILFPRYWTEVWPGQLFSGLDLASGRLLWTSPLFRERRILTGHSAGTAAMERGIGVIALPLADTVVAFDTRTGATRWTAGAHGARGAPLIIGDQVIVAGRNGRIDIRTLTDGALTCTITRRVGYDRAGPVRSNGVAIFVNLDGDVEAIPLTELASCTAENARRPAAR